RAGREACGEARGEIDRIGSDVAPGVYVVCDLDEPVLQEPFGALRIAEGERLVRHASEKSQRFAATRTIDRGLVDGHRVGRTDLDDLRSDRHGDERDGTSASRRGVRDRAARKVDLR